MPPLAAHTYRIQNGMNLYNVGFACGLLAFICVPLMTSLGADPTLHYRWASGYNQLFTTMLGIFCLGLIVVGLFFSGKPVWASWAGYRRLLLTSGRAPSDYLRMFGPAPVLINMGVNGLIGTAFILLGGGDLNGPTVGGILTIMGFSAFGKHALNITPVMAGVFLGSIVMHWELNQPAVQLACLFCTTLAPIAGYFGWIYGVIAGFLHSSVVLYTSSPVAAPRAADRGSNSMARVRGMNRKYSTENSTTPTWNLGISSVNRVASPYRDMDRTKIISFWDCVAVCFCAILIAYFPPYDGVFLAHTGTVYHRDVNSSPKVL